MRGCPRASEGGRLRGWPSSFDPCAQLLDSPLPVVTEAFGRGCAVISPQRLDDSGVVLGGEAHPASTPKIRPHVAAGHLPKCSDDVAETSVRAALKEGSVPFLVQVNATVYVAPGTGQLPVDLAQ